MLPRQAQTPMAAAGKEEGQARTLCDSRKLRLKPLEVDERDKERRRLNVGLLDEELDERLERGQARRDGARGCAALVVVLAVELVVRALGWGCWRGRVCARARLVNNDHRGGLGGEVACWCREEGG